MVRCWYAEQITIIAAEVRCNAQQAVFKDNQHPSPFSHYEANNQWHLKWTVLATQAAPHVASQ